MHILCILRLKEGSKDLVFTLWNYLVPFECGFKVLMTVKLNILYREVYTMLLWLNIDFFFHSGSIAEMKNAVILLSLCWVSFSGLQREKYKHVQMLWWVRNVYRDGVSLERETKRVKLRIFCLCGKTCLYLHFWNPPKNVQFSFQLKLQKK